MLTTFYRLNKIIAMRILILVTAIFICCCINAQRHTLQIDSSIRDYVSRNDFSGNILVQIKGKIVFEKSYGFANLPWEIKNNKTTKFQIGSISKQFTAAAILLLEQEGTLTVEDKIEKYFPEYGIGKNITIEQLLTHTSAIKNVYAITGYGIFKRSDISFEELLSKIKAESLTGKPGVEYNYSNS